MSLRKVKLYYRRLAKLCRCTPERDHDAHENGKRNLKTYIENLRAPAFIQKNPLDDVRIEVKYGHANAKHQHSECPDELKAREMLVLPIYPPECSAHGQATETSDPRTNETYPKKSP